MKAFLAHINTKAELRAYLSYKKISHYQNKRVKVLVMHHTTMESNHPLSEVVSLTALSTGKHNLEEGDQLVILNALDVMHRNHQSYILYKIGNISSDGVPELRFSLLKSKECQQLPPTLGTLVPHSSRAYFMVLVWRCSTEPCPLVPSATNYFWELVDGSLEPVFCTEAPAPKALLVTTEMQLQTWLSAKLV